MRPPLFLFQHTVDIREFVGVNSMGEKAYKAITTIDPQLVIQTFPTGTVRIKCRFEPILRNDRQPEGAKNSYVARLFVLGSNVPVQSTVIFEGSTYIVGECIKHTDLRGLSYLEVMLT